MSTIMEDILYKHKIRKWSNQAKTKIESGYTTELGMLLLFLGMFLIGCMIVGCSYSSIPFTPQSCKVDKQGGITTVSCPDGSTVNIIDGATGSAGSNGTNGTSGVSIIGPQGPAGTPGTVVSFVQFCPGVSLTNFPEQGICVSGSIYAVYWSGSTAFGTLLPLRQYVTTSTTGNCTFTVGANCSITNP